MNQDQQKPRARHSFALVYLLAGFIFFVTVGLALEHVSPFKMSDFQLQYYGTRCLMSHCDPYNPSSAAAFYLANSSRDEVKTPYVMHFASLNIYPPPVFIFTAPFARMPWEWAQNAWLLSTASIFLLVSLLVWRVASDGAPIAASVLLGLLFAGSEMLLSVGNPSGFAMSFCGVAVCCFIQEKFAAVGVVCLALSLALKPHDAGFILLYFLLARGPWRVRAMQTLLVLFILSVPAVIWIHQVAPNWPAELRHNIVSISSRGDLSDPGPTTPLPENFGGAVTSLQTIFSLFHNEPRFYNLAGYLLCLPLVALWLVVTFRCPFSRTGAWLGLASIIPLSMLPVYHRQYDTRLLMLCVPACSSLWASRGRIGRLAITLTSIAILVTGDVELELLGIVGKHLGASLTTPNGLFLTILFQRTQPCLLLLMAGFYLWVYARFASGRLSLEHTLSSVS